MTDQQSQQRVLRANQHYSVTHVGLKKRGLWYRPDAKGYTNREDEAGHYTPQEAKQHEYLHDEPVTIHAFKQPDIASPANLGLLISFVRALNPIEKCLFGDHLAIALGFAEYTIGCFHPMNGSCVHFIATAPQPAIITALCAVYDAMDKEGEK